MTRDALLQTVHVLAAILFVGNVIVTGIWAQMSYNARKSTDFLLAARAIVVTDWWFSVGAGSVLVQSGIWLAYLRGMPIWGTLWIRQAIVALTLSTVLWLVVVVPAQRVMKRSAHDEAALAAAFLRWGIAGWVATVPLVYAVWCMVAKPVA
ncbi:MAG: DUF2269 domain-containing protein [Gemmatimonadaceae bacterium]|nr:DUF2269 domain-containing protein [Gemmatimonadaceae bacterium]